MFNSLLVAYGGYFKDAEGNKHYDYPDIWTSFARDGLANVFLYAAITLAAVLLLVGCFVYLKKRQALKSYVTVALSLAIGFSVTVIISLMSLKFMDMEEDGKFYPIIAWPSIVMFAAVIVSVAASYIASLYSAKTFKITLIASLALSGAALVALLVCIGVYLSNPAFGAVDNVGVIIDKKENLLLYVCAIGVVACLGILTYFLGKGERKGFDSKSISFAAICIAMSFALSYLKLFSLPQGGSVTIASLLPLMIYAYMFGVRKGVFAGLIYGILQAVQDTYIIHPAQFLLDYPIAFACIGLAGAFAHVKQLQKYPQVQFALGAVLAGVLRFISHVLSGAFAFSEWAYHWGTGEAMNPWLYSLGYNSFVFVDIAIVLVAGIIIFSSKSFVKAVRRYNTTLPDANK